MRTYFKTLFLLVSILGTTVHAESMKAYIRQNGDLKLKDVQLEDLISSTKFEGKYFTIVKGSSNNAVAFNDDQDLVNRASNSYYHLTQARKYFMNLNYKITQFDPEQHIVIRIEQDKTYDEYFHYANNQQDNGSGSMAGALTITEDKYLVDNEHSWSNEIWFFKKTKFKIPAKVSKISGAFNQAAFKSPVRQTFIQSEFNAWLSQESLILNYTGFSAMDLHELNTVNHLSGMIIPLALIEVVPMVFNLATSSFKSNLYMDTAYIPEVIYHEYSHYVLKGVFDLSKNSSLSEAYANYFAYKISGRTKIGEAKNFANISPKNAKSKGLYSMSEEYSAYAAFGSFSFSVLYSVEQSLPSHGEEVVIRSLDYLDSSSSLRTDLPAAFITITKEQFKDSELPLVKLQAALRGKGL